MNWIDLILVRSPYVDPVEPVPYIYKVIIIVVIYDITLSSIGKRKSIRLRVARVFSRLMDRAY